MVTKEELETEAEAWKGINPYLYKEALKKIRFGQYEGAKPSFLFFKKKTMEELRVIAKSKGIKYSGIRENNLIKEIMR